MTTNFSFFDHHAVFGMLSNYEDRLDNNRMAAQMDDINELKYKLIPPLVIDLEDGVLAEPVYENFDVTDAQREILSRAIDQQAIKVEADAQRQLDALEQLRAKL